jgi:hypothetical protein
MAGEVVESSCEKAIFASPQSVAAAVSYVGVSLTLLADSAARARHGDKTYEELMSRLRRALEADRFGFVAHVLALRDGCGASHCPAFALFKDSRRVSANLRERTYDQYIARHSRDWPAAATPPVAAIAPGTGPVAQAPVPGVMPSPTPGPGPALASAAPPPLPSSPQQPPPSTTGLFFPSSASIPAVSIMTAEPTGPVTPEPPAAQEPPTVPRQTAPPEPVTRTPTPVPSPRRAAAAKRPPPTDLNADAPPRNGPLSLTNQQ